MSRRSAFDSARMWMRENTLLHALALTGVSSKRMRYEDIVAAPAESMAEICRWIGEPPPNLSFLDGSQARLAAAHTVSGNPVRFQTGDLTLRVDDEWRRKMPLRSSLLVTALTAPFLFHYGYLPAGADRKRLVGPNPDRGLAESAGA